MSPAKPRPPLTAGDTFHISGVDFRILDGRKGDGDQRIEWLTRHGWVPPDMAVAFVLADFFDQNEEAISKNPEHRFWAHGGAAFFSGYLNLALEAGWRKARDEVIRLRGKK